MSLLHRRPRKLPAGNATEVPTGQADGRKSTIRLPSLWRFLPPHKLHSNAFGHCAVVRGLFSVHVPVDSNLPGVRVDPKCG